MARTLTDRARRYLAAFEEETGATGVDCVVIDGSDRVLIVVAAGEMGEAIGPGGRRIERFERSVGADVTLVENAPTAADFVANALAPAAVYNVTISENDDRVAYVEVADEDRGVAIGSDGQNIEAARLLADRHFDVDDVQLT